MSKSNNNKNHNRFVEEDDYEHVRGKKFDNNHQKQRRKRYDHAIRTKDIDSLMSLENDDD